MPNLPNLAWMFYLPRVILMAVVVLALPALVLSNRMMATEVEVARENYRIQVESLNQTTASLQATEHRLHRLTSSMSAVEQEVRSHLRLIRPGETLMLIEVEDGRR